MNKNKQNAVYLKKIQSDDFDFYKSIYSNKDLMQYVGPLMTDEKITRCFNKSVRETQQSTKNQRLYVIRQRSDDNYVGLIGLNWSQVEPNYPELGIIVSQKKQNQGFALQALHQLINYAYKTLSISTLRVISYADNSISNFISKKIGFKKVNEFIDEHNNIPSIRWEMTKEDFKL